MITDDIQNFVFLTFTKYEQNGSIAKCKLCMELVAFILPCEYKENGIHVTLYIHTVL